MNSASLALIGAAPLVGVVDEDMLLRNVSNLIPSAWLHQHRRLIYLDLRYDVSQRPLMYMVLKQQSRASGVSTLPEEERFRRNGKVDLRSTCLRYVG